MNLIALFRILSESQYAIRLRSAQDIPEPSSLWGSTLGTRAVRMMIAALRCLATVSVVSAGICLRNKINSIDSIVVTWPWDSINYVTLHPYYLLHQTCHSNSNLWTHANFTLGSITTSFSKLIGHACSASMTGLRGAQWVCRTFSFTWFHPSISFNRNQLFYSTFLRSYDIFHEPTQHTMVKIELLPTPFLQTPHGFFSKSSTWPMLTWHHI